MPAHDRSTRNAQDGIEHGDRDQPEHQDGQRVEGLVRQNTIIDMQDCQRKAQAQKVNNGRAAVYRCRKRGLIYKSALAFDHLDQAGSVLRFDNFFPRHGTILTYVA